MTNTTKTSKLGLTVSLLYLAVAVLLIGGELHTRIYNTANSEFAGMLSFAWTLPSSILIAWIVKTAVGATVGDSNELFVLILGFAAVINAVVLYFIGAWFSRFISPAPK